MNERIKAMWSEALRSNQYAQTKDALKNSKGYCCLGVLCDLYLKEKGLEWTEGFGWEYSCLGEGETLPGEVQDWAELPSENPRVYTDGLYGLGADTLGRLNDLGATFPEIAQVIESQF